MNTVHTLSQILCIVLRWAGSCPEYVTDCAKSTACRVTSAVTHIHLAIGGGHGNSAHISFGTGSSCTRRASSIQTFCSLATNSPLINRTLDVFSATPMACSANILRHTSAFAPIMNIQQTTNTLKSAQDRNFHIVPLVLGTHSGQWAELFKKSVLVEASPTHSKQAIILYTMRDTTQRRFRKRGQNL